MTRLTIMTRQIIRDFGTCLLFNGTSAKVIIPSNSTIQGMANITISFWFRSANVGGANRKLFFKNGVYDIGLDSSGQLFAEIVGVNNFGIFSSRNMGDNTWHHFVITYDGSTAAAYLDGVSIASTAVVGAPSVASNANDLGFGQHVANGNEWYLGLMDEIRIYNTSLTSAQVTALYYGSEPSSNPVAWWKFDEGSGSTANDTQGSSNGTITNATYSGAVFMRPRFVVRDFGSCLSFPASGYVSVNDATSLNITGDITISVWARPIPLNTWEEMVFKGANAGNATRQYGVGLDNDNKIRGMLYVGATEFVTKSNIIPAPGQWYHIILTRTGSTQKLYINGVMLATTTASGSLNTTSNILAIGRLGSANAEPYKGLLDEVQIYNTGFTDQDATNLYYGINTNPYPANLVLWHKYDENTGTTTADSSGNGNTGTLSGGSPPTWSTNVFMKSRSVASSRNLVP